MADCIRCTRPLGPLRYGHCRRCAEALSGHKIPDRIECATCEGMEWWSREGEDVLCEDCSGEGSVSTEDWK